MPSLPDWHRAWGNPPVRATLRQDAADFQVTELLDFELSGDGEHDYLWIEKRNANTAWVADRLAAHAGVRESDVGYAGLKDRNAVTRQWFSVRRPSAAGTDWQHISLPGVSVLDAARHHRKLRHGAHRGNRFLIALRDVDGDTGELIGRLERVGRSGVPNYFGEQRFGRAAGNLELAERLFAGDRLRRKQRGFALSAARSWLFNHVLQSRVSDESWNRLRPGDCICLDGSNSYFACEQADEELLARCAALDVHPGATLWGRGESPCHGEVEALESTILQAFGTFRCGLEKHAKRSQRALRLAVRELNWNVDERCVQVEFTLARGSFATAVIRELALY